MGVSIEIVEERNLAPSVADEIVACIADAIDEKGSCSLVLSGGKSPSAIYRLLSRPPRVSEIDWSKVRIYWGDERWVAQDDLQSNYRLAHETLLSQLHGTIPTVYPVNTTLASPEQSATEYEQTIRKAEGLEANQLPTFDVVLLGMGEDGHTASLFPGRDFDAHDTRICIVTDHPGSDQKRITLSRRALFAATKIIFIVKGKEKSETLKRVLQDPVDQVSFPAASYRTASGDVTWFVDTAAAIQLDKSKL